MQEQHVQFRVAVVAAGAFRLARPKRARDGRSQSRARMRRWTRGLQSEEKMEMTKITSDKVTDGVPPATPRADDHRRGFRIHVGRRGEPHTASVFSTSRGHDRCL